MLADRNNANLVYIGGDTQPARNSGNSLGCNSNASNGRLFQGNAAIAAPNRWTAVTCNGTVDNSAPHADSRDMAWDAAGDLLQVDDGGVFKLVNPTNSVTTFKIENAPGATAASDLKIVSDDPNGDGKD